MRCGDKGVSDVALLAHDPAGGRSAISWRDYRRGRCRRVGLAFAFTGPRSFLGIRPSVLALISWTSLTSARTRAMGTPRTAAADRTVGNGVAITTLGFMLKRYLWEHGPVNPDRRTPPTGERPVGPEFLSLGADCLGAAQPGTIGQNRSRQVDFAKDAATPLTWPLSPLTRGGRRILVILLDSAGRPQN